MNAITFMYLKIICINVRINVKYIFLVIKITNNAYLETHVKKINIIIIIKMVIIKNV